MATAQDTRIDQLTERVERLEADVQALRSERQGTAGLWADMSMLRQEMRQVLAALGIENRAPIGALELQRRMAQAGLERNEFSQGIIAARDE